jgi:hypothetical protein
MFVRLESRDLTLAGTRYRNESQVQSGPSAAARPGTVVPPVGMTVCNLPQHASLPLRMTMSETKEIAPVC